MDMIYEACKILKMVLQARAPYDTGNLAMNSIRIDRNRGRVLIGGEIAPYAPYTNEPWEAKDIKRTVKKGEETTTITYKRSAKNPNEGWINRAIEEALPIIQRVLSGKATDKDVKDVMKYYKNVRAERKRLYIEELEKRKAKILGANNGI